MAKFAINFVRTHTYDCYYTIEANDEDEARTIGENLAKYDWAFQDRIDSDSARHDGPLERVGRLLCTGKRFERSI